MNSKRIIVGIIILFSLIAIIIGIIYNININKQKTFYATVIEAKDDYILIKPFPKEIINKKTSKIIINTKDNFNIDDTVLIYYKGEVTETNPSTINVIKIELISTKVAKEKNDKNKIDNTESENKNIKENNNNSNNYDNNNSDNSINNNQDNKINYTEDDIISYFDKKLNEVSNYENNNNYKEKAKEIFITAIDFLFYDGEIKGYKFKDLSNTAKLKVLNTVFNIDDKIEEKFPNYKQELSEKYQDAKSMIAAKYLELTANICANHDDYCTKAKDIWKTIKEKTSISWNTIKKYANAGMSNLKDWYEIYREKN